jgi:ribosomal protein S18 acetylase RimI-like enzyme
MIHLRKIGVDDWPVWRKLRLEALAEAPYAFGSTLADWQGEGDIENRWRERLSTVPLNLVAYRDQNPVGMVSGTAPIQDGTVELISLWVAPEARGHGVGDLLVRTVVEWALEEHASQLILAVFEDNERAAALYRRNGFVDVGVVAATMDGEAVERQMAHCLSVRQSM